MRKLIFLLITLVTVSTNVFADSKMSFAASAPDVVVVGDQFRLTYTVTTQKVRDFRAPSIKGFDVLMGPTRSTFSNTQIINGAMSSESGITFTYILMATTEGDYSIPGATITADGDQMVSNSVKIKCFRLIKTRVLQGQLKEMLLRVDRHLLQQVYPIRIFLLRQRPVKLQFMSKRLCY